MNRRGKPYREFKNIRLLPSGYQVVITREKKEYSKHFAGHSRDALKAAHRWRDKILRTLPGKRKKAIPRSVLSACKLKQPAVGVFHYPDRRFFQVSYRDRKGQSRSKTFSWKNPKDQARAYASAVRFRKSQFR
jgi:hypothetical protein